MDLGCIREFDQDLTGDKNKIHVDSFRVYYDGASISHG